MTASVRLSVKTVRAMLSLCKEHAGCPGPSPVLSFASIAEVERALRPSEKKKLVRKANKSARETKAKSRKEETAEIRAEVFADADGRCELCGKLFSPADPGELHHAFGRARVKQSAQTCLALCHICHWRLTNNLPNARTCWLDVAELFAHVDPNGEGVRLARKQLRWHEARSALSERREGADHG